MFRKSTSSILLSLKRNYIILENLLPVYFWVWTIHKCRKSTSSIYTIEFENRLFRKSAWSLLLITLQVYLHSELEGFNYKPTRCLTKVWNPISLWGSQLPLGGESMKHSDCVSKAAPS